MFEMVAIENLPPANPARTKSAPRHSWPIDSPEDDPPAENIPKTPPRSPKLPNRENPRNSLQYKELNDNARLPKTGFVVVCEFFTH